MSKLIPPQLIFLQILEEVKVPDFGTWKYILYLFPSLSPVLSQTLLLPSAMTLLLVLDQFWGDEV
jgi:hypothetical protein